MARAHEQALRRRHAATEATLRPSPGLAIDLCLLPVVSGQLVPASGARRQPIFRRPGDPINGLALDDLQVRIDAHPVRKMDQVVAVPPCARGATNPSQPKNSTDAPISCGPHEGHVWAAGRSGVRRRTRISVPARVSSAFEGGARGSREIGSQKAYPNQRSSLRWQCLLTPVRSRDRVDGLPRCGCHDHVTVALADRP